MTHLFHLNLFIITSIYYCHNPSSTIPPYSCLRVSPNTSQTSLSYTLDFRHPQTQSHHHVILLFYPQLYFVDFNNIKTNSPYRGVVNSLLIFHIMMIFPYYNCFSTDCTIAKMFTFLN